MSSQDPAKRLAGKIRRAVNNSGEHSDRLAITDVYQALARGAGYAADTSWCHRGRPLPGEWDDTAVAEHLAICGYTPGVIDAALAALNFKKEDFQ